MSNIVVLGAGVSGLTTALLLLLRSNASHKITILAKHMPGDYDIEYASPWAGANFLPMSTPGTPMNDYERNTWPEFARLARDVPEAGVHFQEAREYRRDKDANTPVGKWMAETTSANAWFADLFPNFRVLSQSELPPNMDGGISFTSICLNPPLYLSWLVSQCLSRGAVLRRANLSHIRQAAHLHHTGKPADLILNCTGLSSRHLGGVSDRLLYPARGQIVLVRNDPGPLMTGTSGTDDGKGDEVCYVMNRAAGGGCVLGGCLQRDNWDGAVDFNLANRIMRRAVRICPSLVEPGQGVEGLDVVRHAVGLRPMREGGPRVEGEVLEFGDDDDGGKGRGRVAVVHNYGHGGYGYQTSWGSAARAVELVEEALRVKASL